jgi:nicotinamide mononucleotide transporter
MEVISISIIIVASFFLKARSPEMGLSVLIGLIAGVLNVYYLSLMKKINYVFGLINVFCLAYFFFSYNMYFQFFLYASIFPFFQLDGFMKWSENKKPEKMPKTKMVMFFILVVLSYFFVFYVLKLHETFIAVLDFLILTLSCVAQFFTNLKNVTQWILWIVIDILYIVMLFVAMNIQKDPYVFLLIIYFALMAMYSGIGFWKWMMIKHSMRVLSKRYLKKRR